MKRIGLIALALALSAALAGCSTAENPDPSAPAVTPTAAPQPTVSPNTVTKGMEEAARGVGDAARGAVDDMGRMARNAGDAIQDAAW